MKKALLIVSCALFVAAMGSCKNNAEEEVMDSVIDTTVVEEQPAVEAQATVAETPAYTNEEMLAAAKEAGQAKCNCYKKDAASVEACIKAILSQAYADYQNDEAFKAAMEKEYQNCIKEKAKAAATEATNKAVSAAAKDISKKLNKNN